MQTETQTTIEAVAVGDVFRSSWGYDQTNVCYYQTVRVSKTGRTVVVRRIQHEQVSVDGFMSGRVRPRPNFFVEHEPDKRKKVHWTGAGRAFLRMESFEYAYRMKDVNATSPNSWYA